MICGLDISALSARHVGRRRAAQYATLAGRTHAGHPPARSRSVNLYDPKNPSALLRPRTADLLALFELHQELRKQFRQSRQAVLTDVQLADTDRDPIS